MYVCPSSSIIDDGHEISHDMNIIDKRYLVTGLDGIVADYTCWVQTCSVVHVCAERFLL